MAIQISTSVIYDWVLFKKYLKYNRYKGDGRLTYRIKLRAQMCRQRRTLLTLNTEKRIYVYWRLSFVSTYILNEKLSLAPPIDSIICELTIMPIHCRGKCGLGLISFGFY